jgi:hypothetical protein
MRGGPENVGADVASPSWVEVVMKRHQSTTDQADSVDSARAAGDVFTPAGSTEDEAYGPSELAAAKIPPRLAAKLLSRLTRN